MNAMSKFKAWVEAMRLRTLPVSLAGVVAATAFARLHDCIDGRVVAICLVFATLAQIASNFANEYFDWRDGLDAPGREGPRRGVTEGDLTPRAMLAATLFTIALACVVGCLLLFFGPRWLILVGIGVALGVMAYSAGPFPLSRNGLGEVAVILFFGLVPVILTYYLQSHSLCRQVTLGAVAFGLMGANVLIVNNYRDYDDDRCVNKHTLAVILGRNAMPVLYGLNGLAAAAMLVPTWQMEGTAGWIIAAVYLALHLLLTFSLPRTSGRHLTPTLGKTACLMALTALLLLIFA